MDFSTVTDITIPEGDVLRIQELDGTILWEKCKPVQITYELKTFGSSPTVNTYNYTTGELLDSQSTTYGYNFITFSVNSTNKAKIRLVELNKDDCYIYVNDILYEDPQNIIYDIIDDGTGTMTLYINLIQKNFTIPYIATVNQLEDLDKDLREYCDDPYVTDSISAISFVSDKVMKFAGSCGILPSGHSYRLTLYSKHPDDKEEAGKISFGHRGSNAAHYVYFGFGIMDTCVDPEEESFEYIPFSETDGTIHETTCKKKGMDYEDVTLYLTPLEIDLRNKEEDSDWRFGVIVRDYSTGCTGTTFGGRYVSNGVLEKFLRYQYFGEPITNKTYLKKIYNITGYRCSIEIIQ